MVQDVDSAEKAGYRRVLGQISCKEGTRQLKSVRESPVETFNVAPAYGGRSVYWGAAIIVVWAMGGL